MRSRDRKFQKSDEFSKMFFFIFFFVVIGIIFTGLPRLAIPVGVAYVMGHLLMPLMQRLERLGLSRTLAITLIFAAIVIITIYPIIKLLPILAEEAENFQYYIPKIEKFIGATYVNLRNEVYQRTGLELGDKTLIDLVTYLKDGSRNLLMNLPQYLASLLEWMLLVPLFLFFYMKEVESVKRAILRLTPNSIFEKFYFLSHQFNNQLGGYIFAKIVEASIVGIIITTGLWIMEIRFAFLLGLIAMITNIIPYVGPILGLFPAILLALAEYGISSNFWAVIILYAIANVIDLALVFPILVSKIVDLHPLLVVASVILGSQLLGVVGMVISIPMVAAIKLIIHEIYLEIYPTGKE